jgi:hypothetical protein
MYLPKVGVSPSTPEVGTFLLHWQGSLSRNGVPLSFSMQHFLNSLNQNFNRWGKSQFSTSIKLLLGKNWGSTHFYYSTLVSRWQSTNFDQPLVHLVPGPQSMNFVLPPNDLHHSWAWLWSLILQCLRLPRSETPAPTRLLMSPRSGYTSSLQSSSMTVLNLLMCFPRTPQWQRLCSLSNKKIPQCHLGQHCVEFNYNEWSTIH